MSKLTHCPVEENTSNRPRDGQLYRGALPPCPIGSTVLGRTDRSHRLGFTAMSCARRRANAEDQNFTCAKKSPMCLRINFVTATVDRFADGVERSCPQNLPPSPSRLIIVPSIIVIIRHWGAHVRVTSFTPHSVQDALG